MRDDGVIEAFGADNRELRKELYEERLKGKGRKLERITACGCYIDVGKIGDILKGINKWEDNK